MSKCNGLAGVLFGHKYQPRYNTGEPTVTSAKMSRGDPDNLIDLLDASKPSTYVHDVCTRCGAIAGAGHDI